MATGTESGCRRSCRGALASALVALALSAPLSVPAAVSPRERARQLLAEDFAALNGGRMTLTQVGMRAQELAENAATVELAETLLSGAIRIFERAGEKALVAKARQRLEDCRHPFRVSGDTAVLKLGKRGEIDFVRCPTGTVSLVMRWPQVRTQKVSVSRPYWISKYPLTRRQASFFAPLEIGRDCRITGHEGDYVGITRPMAEGLTEHLTRYFAYALPTNAVVRLPTLAEWEHAYHAGTTDPADPFFDLTRIHQGDSVYQAVCYDYMREDPQRKKRTNAWGIGDWCGEERVLDTLDPATLAMEPLEGSKGVYLVKALPELPTAVDPSYSYAGTNRVSLIRMPFWVRWKVATVDCCEDWCSIRIVIAPPMDL